MRYNYKMSPTAITIIIKHTHYCYCIISIVFQTIGILWSEMTFLFAPYGRGALWEWGEPAVVVGCCTLRLGLGCDAACRRWGSPTPSKVKNLLPPEPPARVVRGDCVGARNPHLCILLLRDVKSEKGERGA